MISLVFNKGMYRCVSCDPEKQIPFIFIFHYMLQIVDRRINAKLSSVIVFERLQTPLTQWVVIMTFTQNEILQTNEHFLFQASNPTGC